MNRRNRLALLAGLLLFLAPVSAWAADTYKTGQITSTSSGDIILGPLNERGSMMLQLSGTWTGSYTVEASLDQNCNQGTGTWVALPGASAETTNGMTPLSVAGVRCVRVPDSGWLSGTTVVTMQASSSGGGSGGGGGGIATDVTITGGSVAISGGSVDVTGDGVPVCTIGACTGVQLARPTVEVDAGTGDPIQYGTIWVPDIPYDVAAFDGVGIMLRGITTAVDQAAVNDSLVTATADQFGSQRVLFSIGGVDAFGVEDAPETAGGALFMGGAVVRSAAAGSSATAGDNATINVDTLGRLWTRGGRPCEDTARITTAQITSAASGNVEIVPLNGSDLIIVCGYEFTSTTAQGVQWIYGTGTACATGETDISGVMQIGATGGIARANAGSAQIVVPAGNAFCVEKDATVQLSGYVTYVRTAAP